MRLGVFTRKSVAKTFTRPSVTRAFTRKSAAKTWWWYPTASYGVRLKPRSGRGPKNKNQCRSQV